MKQRQQFLIFTHNSSLITILLIAFLLINGCKDDDAEPEQNPPAATDILIANQGNFGWGVGTLTNYDSETKTTFDELYQARNQEELGNVFQSISHVDDQYYFVINNSGKIVVTDLDIKKTTEITGFNSPRYLYKVDVDKAYVTDLYANAISIVDLKTNEIIGEISTNGWSEKGVVRNGLFWFTAPANNKIYGVDIGIDQIVDSVIVGYAPESLILDEQESLWVLCTGGGPQSAIGTLTSVIFLTDQRIVKGNVVPGLPTNLSYDRATKAFYFISNEGIYRATTDGVLTRSRLWIPNEEKSFYALKVNPVNSELYVSDVKDFVSKSTIYRYASNGELLDEFSAGIIAGDFFFP